MNERITISQKALREAFVSVMRNHAGAANSSIDWNEETEKIWQELFQSLRPIDISSTGRINPDS